MMTPTRSTLDSLKNTPPQNFSQSSQNERKASIDYFLRPDDNGRERISSFHEVK